MTTGQVENWDFQQIVESNCRPLKVTRVTGCGIKHQTFDFLDQIPLHQLFLDCICLSKSNGGWLTRLIRGTIPEPKTIQMENFLKKSFRNKSFKYLCTCCPMFGDLESSSTAPRCPKVGPGERSLNCQ